MSCEIVSPSCFWTTLFSSPIYWGPLCCSDGDSDDDCNTPGEIVNNDDAKLGVGQTKCIIGNAKKGTLPTHVTYL